MTVSKSVLKSRLLEYLRQLEAGGEDIIVTDHNQPVATISPWKKKNRVEEVFGPWRGKLIVHGDLCGPSGEWEDA